MLPKPGESSGQGLSLQGFSLGSQSQGGSLEAGQLSDTTASAPGSDDEVGSTAATDGSTLRTSSAEHAGSAGSESGGSNVDSVSGQSQWCTGPFVGKNRHLAWKYT